MNVHFSDNFIIFSVLAFSFSLLLVFLQSGVSLSNDAFDSRKLSSLLLHPHAAEICICIQEVLDRERKLEESLRKACHKILEFGLWVRAASAAGEVPKF